MSEIRRDFMDCARSFHRKPENLVPFTNLFMVSLDGGETWVPVCTTRSGDAYGRRDATVGDILSFFLGMSTGRKISKEKILLRPLGVGTEIITSEQYDQRKERDTLPEDAIYMVEFDETSVNHVDNHGRVIRMFQSLDTPPEGVSLLTLPDLLENKMVVWAQGKPPPEALDWAKEELARVAREPPVSLTEEEEAEIYG